MTVHLLSGAPEPAIGNYDVDIVILALDRADDTLAAIASALAQTGVSKHVFILDQGSRAEALRRLVDATRDRTDVTLLATGGNLGVAAGRNLASSLGKGRVIVALDNDAEFASPDTVSRMVAALEAEPRLAAIGCRIVTYSQGCDDLSSWGYPARLLPCAGECFDAVTYVGAGHALRRAAWEQAGGYDATLFFCWEEFDFCMRAIGLGWRVRYRGDIVIRHKVCPERRVDWSANRWFYFVRNRLYIERKLARPGSAIALRATGYLLKGLINRQLKQTIHAIVSAWTMPSPSADQRMPQEAISYIVRNDNLHRGSLFDRTIRQVFSRLVRAPIAAAAGDRRSAGC